MKKKKQWYTVFLLYPDTLTDDYGADLFVDWGHSLDPFDATLVVQKKAAKAVNSDVRANPIEPDDFKCIAVLKGKHRTVLSALDF